MACRISGMRRALALLMVSLVCTGASAQAAPPAEESLQAAIEALAAAHAGNVALYAENLQTHETVALDADRVVQTASVIKLAVLYEALEQVRAGAVKFEDKVELKKGEQVEGSGLLLLLDAPLTLTFKDALTLMVVMSDNTATNLAIDHLGLEKINRRMAALGLENTYMYKKVYVPVAPGTVMPPDQKKYGLGKTTAREMAKLMTRIVRCELGETGQLARSGDAAICKVAVKMLQNQFYRGGVPRYLEGLPGESGTSIANKTGALDAVRNDVAAISSKNGMIVISAFTYENKDQSWGVDQDAELAMARIGRAVVARWSPQGLEPWPDTGKPGK